MAENIEEILKKFDLTNQDLDFKTYEELKKCLDSIHRKNNDGKNQNEKLGMFAGISYDKTFEKLKSKMEGKTGALSPSNISDFISILKGYRGKKSPNKFKLVKTIIGKLEILSKKISEDKKLSEESNENSEANKNVTNQILEKTDKSSKNGNEKKQETTVEKDVSNSDSDKHQLKNKEKSDNQIKENLPNKTVCDKEENNSISHSSADTQKNIQSNPELLLSSTNSEINKIVKPPIFYKNSDQNGFSTIESSNYKKGLQKDSQLNEKKTLSELNKPNSIANEEISKDEKSSKDPDKKDETDKNIANKNFKEKTNNDTKEDNQILYSSADIKRGIIQNNQELPPSSNISQEGKNVEPTILNEKLNQSSSSTDTNFDKKEESNLSEESFKLQINERNDSPAEKNPSTFSSKNDALDVHNNVEKKKNSSNGNIVKKNKPNIKIDSNVTSTQSANSDPNETKGLMNEPIAPDDCECVRKENDDGSVTHYIKTQNNKMLSCTKEDFDQVFEKLKNAHVDDLKAYYQTNYDRFEKLGEKLPEGSKERTDFFTNFANLKAQLEKTIQQT